MYVHTVFKHLTAISALPGGFISTVTARPFLAGMEVQVQECNTQVVAAPVCAIPVFMPFPPVLICAVNSGAAGELHLLW